MPTWSVSISGINKSKFPYSRISRPDEMNFCIFFLPFTSSLALFFLAHTCSTGDKRGDAGTAMAWHFVVTLLSGIFIGLFLAYIVYLSRHRWFENRKHKLSNRQSRTIEEDSTYEEVEMHPEQNCLSFRRNAQNDTNGQETSYADLRKTRDVENTYQSLIQRWSKKLCRCMSKFKSLTSHFPEA